MSVFEVRPVTAANLTQCVELLRAHEKSCVSLAGYFAQNGLAVMPSCPAFFHAVYQTLGDTLCALIMFDESSALILHCIPQVFLPDDETRIMFCCAVQPLFKKIKPYCIMGESFGSELMLAASGLPCRVNNDYELFEYPLFAADEKSARKDLQLRDGLSVRRCLAGDETVLYPLQRDYEIEEVLPPGDSHSRLLCLGGLKKTLVSQYVYAVFDSDDKIPIAKAGTNALGFAWCQIGGVYTVPEWRGQGLARFLVEYIARKFDHEGKRVVLFVKTANLPAQRAYLNAGFMPTGRYKIIYY